MNLNNKKKLAARTFGVGVERIALSPDRTAEIAEAITKQDMRDLLASNAIRIKEAKGRLTHEPGKRRRGPGKIKKKINLRKREYISITRKLRSFAKQLLLQGRVNKEAYQDIRKKIKSRIFKSKAHMNENIKDILKSRAKSGKEKKK